jgi:hypothetical protein
MALVKLVLTTPAIDHPAADVPLSVDTTAVPAVDHPAASTPLPEPSPRPTAVVPVSAGAFTRLNGTPARSEATR